MHLDTYVQIHMYLEKRQSHLQFRMEGILQSFYLWKTGLSFVFSDMIHRVCPRSIDRASSLCVCQYSQSQKAHLHCTKKNGEIKQLITGHGCQASYRTQIIYLTPIFLTYYQAGYFNIYLARDSSKKKVSVTSSCVLCRHIVIAAITYQLLVLKDTRSCTLEVSSMSIWQGKPVTVSLACSFTRGMPYMQRNKDTSGYYIRHLAGSCRDDTYVERTYRSSVNDKSQAWMHALS